jgi:short subunit dehydrogenase-like uncharacterized protein
MAGRSRAKMEEVKTWLAEDGFDLGDVPMVEADFTNQASLDSLAAASSVVVTTVGPYALYGRPVVQARSCLLDADFVLAQCWDVRLVEVR